MKYNPKIHHRRSIRLKNYDYSQAGYYFITICTQNRLHLFGEIIDGIINLNDAGIMVKQIWGEIPIYYNGFDVHEFVVMPNHIHGIIEIVPVGAGPRACPDAPAPRACPRPDNGQRDNGQPWGEDCKTGQPRGVAPTGLSDIVGRYKTLTTKRYIDGVHDNGWQPFEKRVWQRNYWEHIIRYENEYHRIAQYIINNPEKWESDKLNNGIGNRVMESQQPYNHEAWMA